MNNRLLSLLVISIFFGGLFGAYYYFFVANVGTVSFVINGSGTTSIELVSEFRNSYTANCEKLCVFEKIPPVAYLVRAKKEGYTPLEKTFTLGRGDNKKMVLALDKEAILREVSQKKEETITVLKFKKDIADTINTMTGSTILGYRAEWLYFAVPTDNGWMVSLKNDAGVRKLFPLPKGELPTTSLDVYEGYIELNQDWKQVFYARENGIVTSFDLTPEIIGIKDTKDPDIKVLTTKSGVFMYRISDKTSRENPLYDDIVMLPTGKIVALIKKNSTKKLSLLSLPVSGNDCIVLIGTDTRERKILLQTSKNGYRLQYKNREIIFIDDTGNNLILGNVE